MRPADLKPRVVGLLQASAFLAAVFSIATLASHLHRYLELFSHFRLQYLAVAIILAVVLFALRSRGWGTVMLIVSAINLVPVAPWYLGPAVAAASDQPIRLVLSNMYSGNRNAQELIELVLAEKADVVFLQEVTPRHSRELAALRETLEYSLNIPRDDNFGIAVLSRHPFTSAKVVRSPPLGLPTLVVQIAVDDRPISFVTTHPMPPLGAAEWFAGRNEQLASVARLINGLDGPRVLIGDLNTTMWAAHFRQLVRDTGLINARYGFGLLPTWPAQLGFAGIPIDHCLVSNELSVLNARTGPDVGSDHLPLIVDVALTSQ